MKNKKLWFRAKSFGWGWTPITWEGWIVTIAYVLALIRLFFRIKSTNDSGSDTLINFLIPFIILTLIFMVICYLKGEKPGWHWGNSEAKK